MIFINSVWIQDANISPKPSLDRNIKTEVLIIGAGMAGILCAYKLDKAGVPYVVAEADRICSKVTKNTTAKITVGHGLIYDKLINSFGKSKAKMYLEANDKALKEYFEICKKAECDFEEKDSFVYSLDDLKKIEKEVEALNRLGYEAELCKNLPLDFSVSGAVKYPKQAQFNPLKLIAFLAKDLNIYENTKVLELTPDGALTSGGTIKADKIIVTTHFPFLNKHGSYFLKQYQHRSYVIAYKNAPDLKGMYVDENEKGLSLRNYKNMLLIGGGSHRTGKKGGNWGELDLFAKEHYPSAKEVCRWATQDCMTLDGISYIGQYSKNTPNLYVATGFNKWGMTSSMAAAELLKDLITKKDNPYKELFSPSRSILQPQLAINAFEAVTNLLTPSKKRCPHMGCALKWNSAEHSWDCSCHGSRFTQSGKLLNSPATDDMNTNYRHSR